MTLPMGLDSTRSAASTVPLRRGWERFQHDATHRRIKMQNPWMTPRVLVRSFMTHLRRCVRLERLMWSADVGHQASAARSEVETTEDKHQSKWGIHDQ